MDRTLVAEIYEAHRPYLRALASRLVGPTHAEDVVQEVAVRLCTDLDGLRDPQAVRTWLARCAVHVAVSWHRRRRGPPPRALQAATTEETPESALLARERADAVRDALARLTPAARRRLLRHMCGPPGVCGMTVADRAATYRARRRLRAWLADDPRIR